MRLYASDASRPARSALGEHIIQVARTEGPTDIDRQRVLDGVLAALRQLTRGAA